ncbi:MAG: PAS domain S-box protein [Magnetococcales bacterium]|nr:PAS domain S-box protein [Magnetococcales bacterium]
MKIKEYQGAWLGALAGLLLTLAASLNVREQLHANFFQEFDWTAQSRVRALETEVSHAEGWLEEVTTFLRAAGVVRRDQFEIFVRPILEKHGYFLSIRGYGIGEEGEPDPIFAVSEGAGARFPEDPARRAALKETLWRALSSGHMAMSGKLELPEGLPPMLAIAAPVRTAGSGGSKGRIEVVLVLIDFEHLVSNSINLMEPRGIDVKIEEVDNSGQTRLLGFYPSRLREEGHYRDVNETERAEEVLPMVRRTLHVADRSWVVTCQAIREFRSAEAFLRGHWAVLIGGIIFTALLFTHLFRSRHALLWRLEMEETLRQREELFREMTETVDLIFWAVESGSRRLLYLGPGFLKREHLDLERNWRGGEGFLERLHPEDRLRVLFCFRKLQRRRKRFSLIVRLQVRYLGERWFLFSGFPVDDSPGGEIRLVGFLEDVTERRQAEETLREGESRLRALFNHTPDILLTVDIRGMILTCNRPLGLLRPGAQSGDSALLLPEAERTTYRLLLDESFRSGNLRQMRYEDRKGYWWHIRLVPVVSAEKVMSVMAIITDITEYHRLEQQAIRTARLASIGVLAAGVAHEINNPNQAMLMNATRLRQVWGDTRTVLNAYAREFGDFVLAGHPYPAWEQGPEMLIGDILHNAQRVQRIVEHLKYLSRPGPARVADPVNLVECLSGCRSILGERIRKYTDRFTLSLESEVPPVRGNAQQLEQVFLNLILNALESLPDRDAAVEISTGVEAETEMVRVTVRDQGCGINADSLQHLGEPFFSTKTDMGGMGMGLSISQAIVENHGGRMRFDSCPGEGTTVTVSLPRFTPGGDSPATPGKLGRER